MSEKDQLKLLAKFSQKSSARCAEAYLACAGDFWLALHALCLPEIGRADLLGRLTPSDPPQTLEALRHLRLHFDRSAYLEAWMRIEDEELQAAYQEPDSLFLPMQAAELAGIVKLLTTCKGGDLVQSAISLLYDWPGVLPEFAIAALLPWVRNYDAQVSGAAIRVFVEFPAAVAAVLPAFADLLHGGKTPQRYDVAWTLWTLAGKGHHYPELREAYHKVAYLGTATEQHFMQGMLQHLKKP